MERCLWSSMIGREILCCSQSVFPPGDLPHHACHVISTENWKPGTLGKFQNFCGPLLSYLQNGKLLPALGLREEGA